MVSSLHAATDDDELDLVEPAVPAPHVPSPEVVPRRAVVVVPPRAVRVDAGPVEGRHVDRDPEPHTDPPEARPRPLPPTAPSSARGSVARAIGVAVSMLAAMLAGLLLYLGVFAGVAESRTQENLFKTFRGELSQGIAPVTAAPVGAPVAIVTIPRLGLRAVVVEGTAGGQLLNGPGHRRDTPLPGQPGTSVLFGRRTLAGAPFAHLDRLQVGDVIQVVTGQSDGITFKVKGIRDSRAPFQAVPSTTPGLSLVTADPPLRPTHSLIVSATLTSAAQQAAGTRPAIGPADRSLAGDGSALLPTVLWGQALVLVMVATSWAYLRWARWSAYVLTTPVVLAVLWNIYENVARMLPNLL